MKAVTLILAASSLSVGAALAEPSWWKSLLRPDTGTSCCDISDCKTTNARFDGENWSAQLPNGNWAAVPYERILWDRQGEGPNGRPVLCASPSARVYCFVPPAQET